MTNLTIPLELEKLISLKKWSSCDDDVKKYELNPMLDMDINTVFSDQWKFVPYCQPFFTLEDNIVNNEYLKKEYLNEDRLLLHDGSKVNPKLVLVIADFGIGSDAFLCLDYSIDIKHPRVIREEYVQQSEDNPNITKVVWTKVADNFIDFCKLVGLDKYL